MTGARSSLVAALLGALLAALVAAAAPAVAADDGADRYAADRVVVVGVPGLTWTDVSPDGTPELWDLAGSGAVGSLTVRAARSLTCLLDGWASLGAGNRARYPGPEEPPPAVPLPLPEDPATGDGAAPDDAAPDPEGPRSLCDLQQLIAEVSLTEPQPTVARIAEDEGTRRFGAQPGALGAAVGCATAVGRPAAIAVAADGVEVAVTDQLPPATASVQGLLTDCPLSVISLDALVDTADLGPEEAESPLTDDAIPPVRAAALADVDAALGRIRDAADALPGETLLVVAGVSEVDDHRPRLHVAVAAGPGFDPGSWLTSASTGRSPYVQLIDLAPTALRALDRDVPASMNGQPVRPAGGRPALGEAVDRLEELNVAARAHYKSTGILFWSLVAGVAAVVALGVAVLGRRAAAPSRRGPRRLLRLGALAVAAAPIATYLAGLVPWERSGSPRLLLLAAVLAADLLVVLLAAAGPWRRRRLGPPLVVLAVTAGTLVADVLTGSHLEMNGLLGYDAIVAGRFTGFGNLTFGLVSVAVLLLTAAGATAVGRRVPPQRRRTAVAASVTAVGVVTVVVVGLPSLGRDFGGVLAALPGFALLGMLLTRTRVTVVRLVAVLAAAVVAVGTVAVLDWLRPAGERTHLGRFVEQVLSGEATTVVLRKAQANLDILLGSPLVWTLPSALLAAVWLLHPGGMLRTRRTPDGRTRLPGDLSAGDTGALRAGLLAVGVSLLLGAAVNDSGVAVPATAAALLVPLLVWLAAAPAAGAADGAAEGDAPRSGPAEDGDRVTVVSRGSTVWNA